jgi:hypothetical protein
VGNETERLGHFGHAQTDEMPKANIRLRCRRQQRLSNEIRNPLSLVTREPYVLQLDPLP